MESETVCLNQDTSTREHETGNTEQGYLALLSAACVTLNS